MSTPDALIALVERFGDNRDAYRSARYNETQARREFIDLLAHLTRSQWHALDLREATDWTGKGRLGSERLHAANPFRITMLRTERFRPKNPPHDWGVGRRVWRPGESTRC